MLTSDLLRYQIDDRAITPRYLTRRNAEYYLRLAGDLIKIYRDNLGNRRGDLEKALESYEQDRVGYKIQRGLAKILDGFAEFEPDGQHDYPKLRSRLFAFAERYRPIVRQADLVHEHTKELIVKKFVEEFGAHPDSLYGDLPQHQIFVRMNRTISREELIRRYNLALAQGILYRCHSMEIKIWDSFKTVFRYLKLAQLMHKIHNKDSQYHIRVDGPFALFRRTQKYGVNLSRFLPGLILANKWQMSAWIQTEQGQRHFTLDQNCGLTSHYTKENPFDSKVEETFYNNFNKRKTDWKIERETEIVDLGDAVVIPDFKFRHPGGGEALLEIVGFWTPEYLENKLKKLRRVECEHLIVAVNETLNCSRDDFKGPVIFFKTRLKTGDVLKILDETFLSRTSRKS